MKTYELSKYHGVLLFHLLHGLLGGHRADQHGVLVESIFLGQSLFHSSGIFGGSRQLQSLGLVKSHFGVSLMSLLSVSLLL